MKIKDLFICPAKRKGFFLSRGINLLFLLAFIALLCSMVFSFQIYDWKVVYAYRVAFLKGWITTCLISLICLMLSFIMGTIAALMRRSKVLIVRYLALFYIEAIRGTPLLVQLLVFFYVIAAAIQIENRFLLGIVTLSLFSGAYIAEIVRSGIESIRGSLLDSAKAIGMTPYQTYRYVIFPLVFRQILPPLTGQFASIIKDSSLLSIIGISEVTYMAQQISSATYSTLESYFPLAIGYLILTLPVSLLSKFLEKRFRYDS